ncbi:hypothetical protein D5R55_34920 [Burkholderia cenocepacia]|uniref:Uncharacterized protein n=1 Tax=Burkholderia cenocepacia TaxID=95486 RepID=A0A3Q9FDJ9_9BURK|nr:hypothetical protein D5R55_34920 [Burkholderia cenocepacia]
MISRPIAIARGERVVFPAILAVSNDIDSARPNGSNGVEPHLAKEKNMTLADPVWALRVAAATRQQDLRRHAFGSACRATRGYAHAGREVTNG